MKSFLFLGLGVLACVAMLVTILLVYKHSQRPKIVYPTQHTAPVPEIVDSSKNICTKQYPTYPPLSSILTTPKNRNLGVYSGKITTVDARQHTITVTSQTNNQPFTFQSSSFHNVLYDIHHSKINNFNALQTGTKAVVSFSCAQEPGYFILNQFQLVL